MTLGEDLRLSKCGNKDLVHGHSVFEQIIVFVLNAVAEVYSNQMGYWQELIRKDYRE
jgi:hypothetical protein